MVHDVNAILNTADMNILTEASQLVEQERFSSYGNPTETGKYDLIASFWSVIFKTKVTAKQVVIAMIALKLAREILKPQRDNLVDVAGYALILEQLNTTDEETKL